MRRLLTIDTYERLAKPGDYEWILLKFSISRQSDENSDEAKSAHMIRIKLSRSQQRELNRKYPEYSIDKYLDNVIVQYGISEIEKRMKSGNPFHEEEIIWVEDDFIPANPTIEQFPFGYSKLIDFERRMGFIQDSNT